MTENNSLEILRQSFQNLLPPKDARMTIGSLEFIILLTFSYLGDSKTSSLESIRRLMKNYLGKEIKRNSFWDRLAGNQLKKNIRIIVSDLMKKFSSSILLGKDILILLICFIYFDY